MVTTLISPEEYLASSYEPDAEYVDGIIVERPIANFEHSDVQGAMYAYIRERRKHWAVIPLIDCRIKLGPALYRVPDICALPTDAPRERVPSTPPVFTIEILSPEDRFADIQQKAAEYLDFGIKAAWTVDPIERAAYEHGRNRAINPVLDGILRVPGTQIAIDLSEVFSDLS